MEDKPLEFVMAQECFYSVQGEGRYVGCPSLFIRFAGCNLNCLGFGQLNPLDQSTWVNEPAQHINSLEEYQTPKYGCDTSYAKDKEYCHLWKHYTLAQMITHCLEKVGGSFKRGPNSIHLVITGGEPMLHQKQIVALLKQLKHYGLEYVTIETNGTIMPSEELEDLTHDFSIYMSISPKLHCCSGIPNEKAFKPDVLNYMSLVFPGQLKFVCGKQEEVWDEVKRLISQLDTSKRYLVMIMPVGSDLEQMNANATWVAERCMKEGYQFSPRLHIYLWANSYDT